MNQTHLVFPQLESAYRTLAPLSEALLRVVVGLWMVPHGLRMAFGFFPGTGIRQGNVRLLAIDLDAWGYRPGWLWAPLIAATELIAGPMLALGLFTRAAAVPHTPLPMGMRTHATLPWNAPSNSSPPLRK